MHRDQFNEQSTVSDSNQSHDEQNIQGWWLVFSMRALCLYTNIMFIGTDLRNCSSIIAIMRVSQARKGFRVCVQPLRLIQSFHFTTFLHLKK